MVKVVDEIRVVGFGHPMVGVLPSTPMCCDGERDFLWEWWWWILRMGFAEGREERIRRRRRKRRRGTLLPVNLHEVS